MSLGVRSHIALIFFALILIVIGVTAIEQNEANPLLGTPFIVGAFTIYAIEYFVLNKDGDSHRS